MKLERLYGVYLPEGSVVQFMGWDVLLPSSTFVLTDRDSVHEVAALSPKPFGPADFEKPTE